MSAQRGIGGGPGIPGLVSVVIASYNRGYIVAKAIESVLAQTYKNIEVLVADDGSRDDTQRVVEAFGAPVRWLWQPNEGLAGARNLGLRHARGEFIAILDSDDEWLPWKLEAQIPIMQRFPALALVGSDMTAVDAAGRVLEERHLRTMYTAYQALSAESIMPQAGTLGQFWSGAPAALASAPVRIGDLFPHLLHGSLIQPSTVLIRRTVLQKIDGWDRASIGGEDYDFFMRLSAHGEMALLDTPTMLYRVGASDQLTAPGKGVPFARAALRSAHGWKEISRGRVTVPEATFERRVGDILAWLGEEELGAGDRASARTHLWQAMRRRPRRRTALLLAAACAPGAVLELARRGWKGLRAITGRSQVAAHA